MSKIYQGLEGFLAELVHGQTVKFYPRGGGFQHEIPLERFLEEFKEHAPDPTLRPAWFEIDGGPRYRGYHRGDRWNGWAMPYFTLEAGKAIMERWEGSDVPLTYDENATAFTAAFEDPEVYEGEVHTIEGRAEILYPIGAGSWCWDAYETETETETGDE
jgi:hypothetical protein